jgi:hypothetical protein
VRFRCRFMTDTRADRLMITTHLRPAIGAFIRCSSTPAEQLAVS